MEIKIYINDEKVSTDKTTQTIDKITTTKSYKCPCENGHINKKDASLLDCTLNYIPAKLSARTYWVLKNAKILTYGDLISYTESGFLRFKNCGRKTLTEMQDRLKMVGLEFKKN